MISRQLDILALEPFFGGIRRNMLETLVRYSRHRWVLLTLPPRRIERRLAAAAHWFAEQIARRGCGPVDVLFAGDALNLADLYRLCPNIASQPSVAYFHTNQLPDAVTLTSDPRLDLMSLTSATSATEIWFNSKHHVASFIDGIKTLVELHPELRGHDPLVDLKAKLHLVPPPIDTAFFQELESPLAAERDPVAVFVETRDANLDLLNGAIEILHSRKHPLRLLVSGPVKQLSALYPHEVVPEYNAGAQVRALLTAGIFVSTKIAAPFDENAVRAMSLGCRPVFPHTGVYPEIVPASLQSECLYDMSAESLATHIHEAMYLHPLYRLDELSSRLKPFDALRACALIDERLDAIAAAHVMASFDAPKKLNRESSKRVIPN